MLLGMVALLSESDTASFTELLIAKSVGATVTYVGYAILTRVNRIKYFSNDIKNAIENDTPEEINLKDVAIIGLIVTFLMLSILIWLHR